MHDERSAPNGQPVADRHPVFKGQLVGRGDGESGDARGYSHASHTGRNHYLSNYDNRKQRELTERGQITDRFSTAVDQLGHKERNVRLGGIYALERIMRDSESDQPAIVESSSRLSATEHLSPAATTMITQQPTCRRR